MAQGQIKMVYLRLSSKLLPFMCGCRPYRTNLFKYIEERNLELETNQLNRTYKKPNASMHKGD